MKGVEEFLKNQGIRGVSSAPLPREVDLFDPFSWTRGLAETFAPERLARIEAALPQMLSQAFEALPQNGPQFTNKVYQIAENICVLKAQGKTPEEIARHIFLIRTT